MSGRSIAVALAVAATLVMASPPAGRAAGELPSATLPALIQRTQVRIAGLQECLRRLATAVTRAEARLVRAQAAARADGDPTRLTLRMSPRVAVLRTSGVRARLRSAGVAYRRAERRIAADPVFDRLRRAQARLRAVTAAEARSRRATLAGAVTRGSWALDFLRALEAPRCPSNLHAVVTWEAAENTSAAWNPLATTLVRPGSTTFNSARVQAYPSREVGVRATIATLRLGYLRDGYGWIVYRLATCAPAGTTVAAINASDWCHACAGGRYVIDQLRATTRAYAAAAAVPLRGGGLLRR